MSFGADRLYGPTTGSIDARNHDNHYNSPVLSTFFPEGQDNHYNSPVLRVFGKKVAENCRENHYNKKVVMVSLRFRRPLFENVLKTGEL